MSITAVVEIGHGGRSGVRARQVRQVVPRERIVAGLDDARDVVIGEGPQPQSLRLEHRGPGPRSPGEGRVAEAQRSGPGVDDPAALEEQAGRRAVQREPRRVGDPQ
jgi:hypothetical protein